MNRSGLLKSLLARHGLSAGVDDGSSLALSGTASASGDAASAKVSLGVAIGEADGTTVAIGTASAAAQATGSESSGAAAAAATEASVGEDLKVVTLTTESSHTGGDDPTAVSVTQVEAVGEAQPMLRVDLGELQVIDLGDWF